MSILDQLKFTDVKRHERAKLTAEDRVRGKMLEMIDTQKKIAEAEAKGEEFQITRTRRDGTEYTREPRRWWYYVDDKVFMDIRYGNRSLNAKDGLHTVEVGALENVIPTLNVIADAVREGEMDEILLDASKRTGRKKANHQTETSE